jgi:hypothetical protein
MRRVLLLVAIFGPAIIILLSVWVTRATRASSVHEGTSSGQIVVPAGTTIRIRLVQGVTAGTQIGENLQGLTAGATLQGTQMIIPEATRALVEVMDIHKENPEAASVTMQLNELMFKDRDMPVHSAPITAKLDRLTDLGLMSRAAGGLIGGAVGAAGSAAVRGNPQVGATAIGGLAAGGTGDPNQEKILSFQILQPIDLTGIRW